MCSRFSKTGGSAVTERDLSPALPLVRFLCSFAPLSIVDAEISHGACSFFLSWLHEWTYEEFVAAGPWMRNVCFAYVGEVLNGYGWYMFMLFYLCFSSLSASMVHPSRVSFLASCLSARCTRLWWIRGCHVEDAGSIPSRGELNAVRFRPTGLSGPRRDIITVSGK